METDKFTNEAQPDDILQVAGDAALDAATTVLNEAGVADEDFSIVVMLNRGKAMATAMHLHGEVGGDVFEDEHAAGLLAFETQLIHLRAAARALGLDLHVVPMPGGQG